MPPPRQRPAPGPPPRATRSPPPAAPRCGQSIHSVARSSDTRSANPRPRTSALRLRRFFFSISSNMVFQHGHCLSPEITNFPCAALRSAAAPCPSPKALRIRLRCGAQSQTPAPSPPPPAPDSAAIPGSVICGFIFVHSAPRLCPAPGFCPPATPCPADHCRPVRAPAGRRRTRLQPLPRRRKCIHHNPAALGK